MTIIGHGVDVIDVHRVETLLLRNSDFLDGWFTEKEIQALGNRVTRPDVVAGRVAAKEASVKALGTGFAGRVSWQDVEIIADESGAPRVILSDGALEVAQGLGVEDIVLSLSHTSAIAIASVIVVGNRARSFPDT